jgi:hypothetical protein
VCGLLKVGNYLDIYVSALIPDLNIELVIAVSLIKAGDPLQFNLRARNRI